MTHLIQEETLRVEKSLITKTDSSFLAAIDRGSTLTKILYTTSTDSNEGQCELHFALFRNKHFDSALEFLKEKLNKDEGTASSKKNLHVTGVGTNMHGDVIKAKLGVEIEFIDEVVSQLSGFHFLLKNFQVQEICHPTPTLNEADFAGMQRGETFQRIRDAQAAMMKDQAAGQKFPCLFAIFGSSAGVVLMNEDGSIAVKHRHLLAGKSFLGLCQLLIGTNDYKEIMDMAATGNRGNIDTQVRDILADSPNSPYGRMPASLPFFPFGKAVDFDKTLESIERQDIAHSLVSSFTVNFVNIVTHLATYEKIRNVYFGGNFFKHEFPRLEVMKYGKIFGTSEIMSPNFLKTGHTGALGAMLSTSQDVADFFAAMKVNG